MTSPDDRSEGRSRNPPPAEPHRFTVDEDCGVALSVVDEMANVLGCAPPDLKPLYYDVDLEMLERTVDSAERREFSFTSNEVTVTVYGDGTILFEPTER